MSVATKSKGDAIRRAEDTLRDVDLTVERALTLIDPARRKDYEAAYRWFMDQSGTIGSRLYGKGQRLPGVSPDFAHAAQRGIHKPARSPYALSVTVKNGAIYDADSSMVALPDGMWELVYSEHRNHKGMETDTQWNDSLMRCLEDGIPVGVFVEDAHGYYRALAFVEEYRPQDGTFVLHGPVTPDTEGHFRSEVRDYLVGEDFQEINVPSVEELMRDERTAKQVRRKVREGQHRFREELVQAYGGQCAVTGVETNCTLQAAHILDYRGGRSNVVENGILLRSDIHALFDASMLAFDPKTVRVVIGNDVVDDCYRELEGSALRLPKDRSLWPSEQYLQVKFDKFERLQSIA